VVERKFNSANGALRTQKYALIWGNIVKDNQALQVRIQIELTKQRDCGRFNPKRAATLVAAHSR
jgi:hypothetical protein